MNRERREFEEEDYYISLLTKFNKEGNVKMKCRNFCNNFKPRTVKEQL